MNEKEEISCIPAFDFKRNEYGLLTHVNYVFNKDGSVNWRKMVPNEFVVPNSNKTSETEIDKIPDEHLLILLAGLKEVAQIRGYEAVVHTPIVTSERYVSVKTSIVWIPNFETNGKTVEFSSLANASIENTEGFGNLFLMEIAENRGFCRAVRNFLKIHVLSKDEMPKGDKLSERAAPSTALSSADALKKMMDEAGINFDKLKSGMMKKADWKEKAQGWGSFEDIEEADHFEIMGFVKDHIKRRKNKLEEQ